MRSIALSLAAAALTALAPAHAASLPADGSWASFTVDGNLPPYSLGWIDDAYAPLSFSFTVADGYEATLTVVDAGFTGDRFDVSDNGLLLGTTSVAPNGDVSGASVVDFSAALANPDFSRGIYTLGAGNHSITGLLTTSTSDSFGPLNATLGGVQLTVSAVPEPATLGTLLAGLGLFGFVLRRRNA
jgi:hypothetical protein